MAGKKSSARAAAPTVAANKEPTKAELQRRMEEAREDISQTVEDIKETVTEQYESVKEIITGTLDWREHFRKHTLAWSLGAVAVGYVVGSGLAASLKDTTQKKGRKSGGLLDDIYAYGESLADEISGVAQTVLLPALSKKLKDTLGIDLSDKLLTKRAAKGAARPASGRAKKASTKKSGRKTSAAKKGAAKRATKKGGSK